MSPCPGDKKLNVSARVNTGGLAIDSHIKQGNFWAILLRSFEPQGIKEWENKRLI